MTLQSFPFAKGFFRSKNSITFFQLPLPHLQVDLGKTLASATEGLVFFLQTAQWTQKVLGSVDWPVSEAFLLVVGHNTMSILDHLYSFMSFVSNQQDHPHLIHLPGLSESRLSLKFQADQLSKVDLQQQNQWFEERRRQVDDERKVRSLEEGARY